MPSTRMGASSVGGEGDAGVPGAAMAGGAPTGVSTAMTGGGATTGASTATTGGGATAGNLATGGAPTGGSAAGGGDPNAAVAGELQLEPQRRRPAEVSLEPRLVQVPLRLEVLLRQEEVQW